MADKAEDSFTAQSKHRVRVLSKFMILIVVVYLATYASLYGLRFVLATEYPIVVVEGVSMEKTYYAGDLLILRGMPKESIKIGDVVVYRRTYGSLLIVHRIVNIFWEKGVLYFITQGDNRVTNPSPDRAVPAEDVVGVAIAHVPALGGIVLALQSPVGLVFSGILIVIILLLDVFGEGKSKAKTG